MKYQKVYVGICEVEKVSLFHKTLFFSKMTKPMHTCGLLGGQHGGQVVQVRPDGSKTALATLARIDCTPLGASGHQAAKRL